MTNDDTPTRLISAAGPIFADEGYRDPTLREIREAAAVARTFIWDAENRLIRVEPTTPADGNLRVELVYDYQGRRVEKKVSVWDGNMQPDPGSNPAHANGDHRTFVWSDWLMLMEIDSLAGGGTGFQPVRSYTWGLDLGGLNGHGGPTSGRSLGSGGPASGRSLGIEGTSSFPKLS